MLLQSLDDERDEVERLAHASRVREVPAMTGFLGTKPGERTFIRFTLVRIERDRQIVCHEQTLNAERELAADRRVRKLFQSYPLLGECLIVPRRAKTLGLGSGMERSTKHLKRE